MSLQIDLFTKNNSYHDSTRVQDDNVLASREKKARHQDELILKLFSDHPHTSFTPVDVHLRFGQCWPLTSVRRGISNLTKKGFLIVTGEKRMGLYGVENNAWKLNPEKI
jgi:hypothetical protein